MLTIPPSYLREMARKGRIQAWEWLGKIMTRRRKE